LFVIASEAKQSIPTKQNGLLRRYAPKLLILFATDKRQAHHAVRVISYIRVGPKAGTETELAMTAER
jgi:hypothetical protein